MHRSGMTTPRSRRFIRSRRMIGAVTTVVLGTAMMGLTTPAAVAAPGDTWKTSFETTDAQPLAPNFYRPAENVTGKKFANGSLLGLVSNVTASSENGASEAAIRAADGVPATKWLYRQTSGWLQYEFADPVVVKTYAMTTANDSPARNPKDWKIRGSNDGSTWTDLDTQTGQLPTSTPAFTRVVYDMTSNSTAYKFYQLNISANNGDSLSQLGDWEPMDGTDNPSALTPLAVEVGSGPISSRTAKTSVGWTGVQSLRYVGGHQADGNVAHSTSVLYDNVDLAIGDDTELSYKIFPILDESDLTWPATYAAIDLELDDGSLVSEANLRDSYGFDFNARAYGEQKALYGSQWNNVQVDLSSLEGRTITKILFTYDNPDGSGSTTFSGWLDDIEIDAAQPIDDSSLLNYVDTRRGSNGTQSFSRGLTVPLTAVPNGFNFVLPYTNSTSQSMPYEYQKDNNAQNKTNLEGIGVSHITSPWMGDRNQFVVTPYATSGSIDGSRDNKKRPFSHDNEVAKPHYYGVDLDNGMKVEGTATDHGGIFRFTAAPGQSGLRVLTDRVAGDGTFSLSGADLTGWIDNGSGLSVGRSRMFVAGAFNAVPTATGAASGRSGSVFGTFSENTVELSWATSFISLEQAQKNLAREVTGKSFEEVRDDAADAWLDRLSVIDLSASQTATDAQKLQIYSDLYRLNLYPNSQHEDVSALGSSTPEYKYASPVAAKVGSATATETNAQIKDGKIYVNNGFWDTYRTAWPAYAFFYPDLTNELVNGFVQQYRDSGWISRWSSPGYADLMTGTSSDVAFAEAYTAGALDTVMAIDAYEAGLKNATALPASNLQAGYAAKDVGRKGMENSTFLGWIPAHGHQTTSWALEGYINDYGLGMMAQKLSEDPNVAPAQQQRYADEAKYLLDRAQNYVKQFDPNVGFFQGRHTNGDWELGPNDYDPMNWGNHTYTETNGWNFAFHVPFDVDGLAALYGGSEGLSDKLVEFFTTPEPSMTSGIHEAYEQRDVRIGTWGMSNQVGHHIGYIPAAGGNPTLTQEIVREVLQRLFVGSEIGQGFPGDEDNGEFSSWHLFSSLGFYPLALGSGEYTIGSPLFDTITVNRKAEHGGPLTITAENNSRDNVYIASAELDGEALDSVQLNQADLRASSSLHFEMAATPQAWGHRTSNEQQRVPLTDATKGGQASVTASTSGEVNRLLDDNATTATTLGAEDATIDIQLVGARPEVKTYTITNGASGAHPTDWVLQGSNNGATWVTLDQRSDVEFAWNTQTKPFHISDPGTYGHYRLHIQGTSTGGGATLAEIELLSAKAWSNDFAIVGQSSSAYVDESASGPYAAITGGSSDDASDYSATVDFGDGAVPADVVENEFGLVVEAGHVFTETGAHDVKVAVTHDGDELETTGLVTVGRQGTLEAQFNNACLSEEGISASCDGLNYSYDKAQLADANVPSGNSAGALVQGVEKTVLGTNLKFTLPEIESGELDNILGEGQTVPMNLSTDATQYSFIGMGNEGDQQGVGTVHYDDGSTDSVNIQFGDWVGKSTSPAFGNIVVGLIQTRLSGTGKESTNKTTAIFATAPVTIPAGKTPVSVTLPNKAGSLSSGKIHIFAIADDGDQSTRAVEPLASAQPSTPLPAEIGVGSILTADLAQIVGGRPGATATVNWGDGTGRQDAVVNNGVVSGEHVYTAAGDYTITVVIDDGQSTVTVTHNVTVKAGTQAATVGLTASPVAPTAADTVTLRATVNATATGFMTFTDGDGNELGQVQVADGVAELEAGVLSVGTHEFTATYGGDGIFRAGDSETTSVTVAKADPTVTLATSAAEVTEGETVVLTATLPENATGIVNFVDGAEEIIGSANAEQGSAAISAALPKGEYTITAQYLGDASYNAANSAAVNVTVKEDTTDPGPGPDPTPAVAVSAPSFSKAKQPFKAKGNKRRTVSAIVTGVPAGTVVTFKSGTRTLGTTTAVRSGNALVASLKLKGKLPVGTYPNVTASVVTSGKTVVSPASAQTFKVVKAKAKKVTVKTKQIKAGVKAKIKVKVSKLTNNRQAVGKIQIRVGKKVVGVKKFKAKTKGNVTVKLRRSFASNVKVRARFVPKNKKNVKNKQSKRVVVKVRR